MMSLDDQITHNGNEGGGCGGGAEDKQQQLQRERVQDQDQRQPSFISTDLDLVDHTKSSRPRSPPLYRSPPPPSASPLNPMSSNTPMASTPFSATSLSSQSQRSKFFSSDSISIVPVSSSLLTSSDNSSSPQPQLSSPKSGPKLTEHGNAITIIQVQPSSSSPSTKDCSTADSLKMPSILQETDLDKRNSGTGSGSADADISETDVNLENDLDGLAITRIKIGGGTEIPEETNTTTQVVKVSVLNEKTVINGQETDNTNVATEEEEGRGPLRLDDGQSQGMGAMGSQPSDLNDTVSEMSSVINNPSVISQIPDRYGFMGGEQYTHESEPDPSPEIVRRREMKWLQMMDKWDHYMRKDFKTLKVRCRKGIPRSVRGRGWYYLCGAAFIKKKNPNLYFELLQQEGRASDIEDIKKDLHRQFPWHEIFAEEGHGKMDLFNVLKAHSILNAKDGYCQAQAPIASILLMHMPAEDAFWCLVAICDKYLKGYYAPGMEQVQLDGDILFGLLKRVAPPVYKHMKKQKIDPVLYMTEWFLCAFTRTLPWTSVLRVWDSFLCEGVKILFRVGLILLKYTLGRQGVLKQCPSMYETLAMLKNLPNYVTHEQFLVVQIQRLDISDDQMRKEHYKQVTKRRKAEQKLEAAKRQQQKQASSGGGGRSRGGLFKSHETSL